MKKTPETVEEVIIQLHEMVKEEQATITALRAELTTLSNESAELCKKHTTLRALLARVDNNETVAGGFSLRRSIKAALAGEGE